MKNFVLAAAALVLAAILSLDGGITTAEAGQQCGQQTHQRVCGRTAPEKSYRGDRQIAAPINVTVCHAYWNRLDIGRLNGRATKWWGPTIRFAGWSQDLPAVDRECKTFSVKPGTSIDTYASCVKRTVSTGRMSRPGTYWLR